LLHSIVISPTTVNEIESKYITRHKASLIPRTNHVVNATFKIVASLTDQHGSINLFKSIIAKTVSRLKAFTSSQAFRYYIKQ